MEAPIPASKVGRIVEELLLEGVDLTHASLHRWRQPNRGGGREGGGGRRHTPPGPLEGYHAGVRHLHAVPDDVACQRTEQPNVRQR
jgi:hypothetical protein